MPIKFLFILALMVKVCDYRKMSEGKEGQSQLPPKIQNVLNQLKPDYAQEDLENTMKHQLVVLSRAELWASGIGGTEAEANQLMSEGFKKLKTFYPEESQVAILNSVLDKTVEARGKESLFSKLIEGNKNVLNEKNKES